MVILTETVAVVTTIIVLFVICITLFVVGLVKSYFIRKSQINELKKRRKTIYEFTIDFNNKQVSFFTRYEGSTLIKKSFPEFFQMIPDARKLRMFKNYINELHNGGNRQIASEIEVLIDNDYVSIYFVQERKDNLDKDILHLVGYSISFSSYSHMSFPTSSGISLGTAFLRKYGKRGYMVYVRYYPFDKELELNKIKLVYKDLNKTCMGFCNLSNLRVNINMNDDKNGFAFIDYVDSTPDEYRNTLKLLTKRLKSTLDLSGYGSFFDFCVGIAKCSDFNEPNECYEQARSVTFYNDDNDDKIQWYNQLDSESLEKFVLAKYELKNLIEGKNRDKKITSKYQPLIDMENNKLFGFYTQTTTYSTSFKSLNDMFEIANECNLATEFSTVILKRLIGIYYNRFVKVYHDDEGHVPQKLFLQLSKYDIDTIFDKLGEVKNVEECNIVFLINEKVLNEMAEKDLESAYNFLESFKTHGYEIALRIKDRDLPWPYGLYTKFDYFLFTQHITNAKEKIESSSSWKSVLTKLQEFEKPFIAVNVNNKSEYKVLYDNNVKILGGSYFGKESEIIIPPNLNKISKLKIKGRY